MSWLPYLARIQKARACYSSVVGERSPRNPECIAPAQRQLDASKKVTAVEVGPGAQIST